MRTRKAGEPNARISPPHRRDRLEGNSGRPAVSTGRPRAQTGASARVSAQQPSQARRSPVINARAKPHAFPGNKWPTLKTLRARPEAPALQMVVTKTSLAGTRAERDLVSGPSITRSLRQQMATHASPVFSFGDKQDVQMATLAGDPCVISQVPREHVFRVLHTMRKGLQVTTLSGRQGTVWATFTGLCYSASPVRRSLANPKAAAHKALVRSSESYKPRHWAACVPSFNPSLHNNARADELSGADTPPALARCSTERGPQALLTRGGLLLFKHDKPPTTSVQRDGASPSSATSTASTLKPQFEAAPGSGQTDGTEAEVGTLSPGNMKISTWADQGLTSERPLATPARGRQTGVSTGPQRGRLTDPKDKRPSPVPLHEAAQGPEELLPGLPKQDGGWTPEMIQLMMSYAAWLVDEHFGKVCDEHFAEIRDLLAKTICEAKTASNQTQAGERKPAAASAVAVRHHQ